MPPTITLYGFGASRALRCEWTLNALGLPFESVTVNLKAGEHKTPEFLAINPMARVPALRFNGQLYTESFAICTLLADHAQRLIPKAGTPDRGQHDQWMYFCATELDAPLWTLRRHTRLLPKNKRLEAAALLARSDCQRALTLINAAIGDREYLVGDQLTVVDLVMAYTLWWADWDDLLDEHPAARRYLQGHLARPSRPEAMRLKKITVP